MYSLKMLLFAGGFTPQDSSYLWNPGVICLQGISAFLIALAYLFIPATVIYFVYRRRGLAFNWMFLCCGIFILACGATHATEVWTLWHATYWLSGSITAITAMAALPTAVLLGLAHNGRLWASQNDTHGATFQFTIPTLH